MPPAKRSKKPIEDLVNRIADRHPVGRVRPGTWLKQIDLETRYKCTRIDLRRALDQLVAKRLVEHVPNRGYHVYASDLRAMPSCRTSAWRWSCARPS